jgi:hypothetical protein
VIWFFIIIAVLLAGFGWIIYKNSEGDPSGKNIGQLMLMLSLLIIGLIILSIL